MIDPNSQKVQHIAYLNFDITKFHLKVGTLWDFVILSGQKISVFPHVLTTNITPLLSWVNCFDSTHTNIVYVCDFL